MKIQSSLSVFIFLLLFPATAYLQDFTVPKNYEFKTAEDYDAYQDTILQCIEWMETTPIAKADDDKRKDAGAFLFMWIAGHPGISIELHEYIGDYTKKNADLLMVFFAGYTRAAIANSIIGKTEGNYEGVKSLIKVYQFGGDIKKDKKVEELIKKEEEGTLRDWVSTQVSD